MVLFFHPAFPSALEIFLLAYRSPKRVLRQAIVYLINELVIQICLVHGADKNFLKGTSRRRMRLKEESEDGKRIKIIKISRKKEKESMNKGKDNNFSSLVLDKFCPRQVHS